MKYITVESVFLNRLPSQNITMFVVVNGMFVEVTGLIFKVRRGIGAIAKLNGMYLCECDMES